MDLLSEKIDVRTIQKLADLLEKRGCSERTIEQYTKIVEGFQPIEVETARNADPADDQLKLLRQAVEEWETKAMIPMLAKSTVGIYKAALDDYFEAKGIPFKASAFLKTRGVDPMPSLPLNDQQLRALRRRTAKSGELRTAVELALAGIPATQIVKVSKPNISFDGGPMKVTIPGRERGPWQIFDPRAREWFRKRKKGLVLPSDRRLTVREVRSQISASVEYRSGSTGNGDVMRRLRETGIRRAIKYGIAPKKVAESLGCEVQTAWLKYPVMRSKARELPGELDRTMSGLEPIDPELSVEEMMALSEQEYDDYIERVTGPKKEK